MNALRRLVERLRILWAILAGIEPGPVRDLPPPVTGAPITMDALVAEAEARGAADAATMMYDHWSFGVEDDAPSEDRDPEYVRSLRRRCAAAIEELHDRNALTVARLSHVYDRARESDQLRTAAQQRMGTLAASEADRERPAPPREAPPEAADPVPAPAAPHSGVWEGEARPLPVLVQLVIVACLMAIEYPMQRLVLSYHLADGPAASLVTPVALSASVLVVLAPYLAGWLFRGNRATGGERRLAPVIVVIVMLWLYAASMLGFLRGRVLATEANAAGTEASRLEATPLTVVIIFVTLLLFTGTMAFLLGLARRHPYQEAYLRSRLRRDWYREAAQRMGATINPSFRGPSDTSDDNRLAAAERVIREACQAAEEAYFASLSRTVGDPTFTEAVSRRRGHRATTGQPGAAPQPAQREAAG